MKHHQAAAAASSITPSRAGILQRRDAGHIPPIVHEVLRSPGQPLDRRTREFMESGFNHDFARVRVHTGAKAAESARAVNAKAYTVGRDLVFGTGQYAPETGEGRQLLAHELTHAMQQSAGSGGQEGDLYEREAIAAARQVLHGRVEPPRVTPSGLQIARAGLGEMWSAVLGVGPWDAYKASRLADRALVRARATGLPGLHNGPADAWRHCYWNCTMTAEIGADQAETIATGHERHGDGPANENKMDLHNNAEGRACGGSDCDLCCQRRLDAGQLRVLDGAGNVIPSSPASRSSVPKAGSGGYYEEQ
ncbi:MAG: DUF4157 domain-containing protein [Methanomicrobiaceae archaeon]|nr:DUF4157 domain-containing protein [Methanomicrobiaceae archaeon]MDD5418726.1 DUF4157 domain-containing protein [Methanomicrobiaceae archaeon]